MCVRAMTEKRQQCEVQANAEQAVRQLLVDFSKEQGLKEVDTVWAEEHMDDGTPIRLAVTIDRRQGSALLDFEGALSMLCPMWHCHSMTCWDVAGCQGVPHQGLPYQGGKNQAVEHSVHTKTYEVHLQLHQVCKTQ